MSRIALSIAAAAVLAGVVATAVPASASSILDIATCQPGEHHVYVELVNKEIADVCVG